MLLMTDTGTEAREYTEYQFGSRFLVEGILHPAEAEQLVAELESALLSLLQERYANDGVEVQNSLLRGEFAVSTQRNGDAASELEFEPNSDEVQCPYCVRTTPTVTGMRVHTQRVHSKKYKG